MIRSTETYSKQTKPNQSSDFTEGVVVGQMHYSFNPPTEVQGICTPTIYKISKMLAVNHPQQRIGGHIGEAFCFHFIVTQSWKRFSAVLERGNNNRSMQSDAKYYAEI